MASMASMSSSEKGSHSQTNEASRVEPTSPSPSLFISKLKIAPPNASKINFECVIVFGYKNHAGKIKIKN